MIIDWPPLVNQELSLDGEHGLSENFIETLEFDSKEKTHLKNSYIPAEFPSLSLMLNNIGNRTEYEEFVEWFNGSLQYGVLPFYFPRIGYRKGQYIKTGEIGIYKFLPNSLRYDRIDGIVIATFGLREAGYLEEIEYIFLTTSDDEILFTDKGRYITVN